MAGMRRPAMKIWKLEFELDKYDNLKPEKEWSIEKIQSFDGRKQSVIWTPVKVVRLEPEKKLGLSDAPGFYSHIPVFSKKAKDILEDCIFDSVELLPMINEEKEYWAVNITKILDCINYEKSIYKTFPDGKRILRFEKYFFNEKKLVNENIFKIKDKPLAAAFVSDEFKDIVEFNNLTGFKFNLVWDSETST